MKEFTFLEFRKEQKDYQIMAKKLAQMSESGWEVVSLTSDVSKDLKGVFIALLQREKKEGKRDEEE